MAILGSLPVKPFPTFQTKWSKCKNLTCLPGFGSGERRPGYTWIYRAGFAQRRNSTTCWRLKLSWFRTVEHGHLLSYLAGFAQRRELYHLFFQGLSSWFRAGRTPTTCQISGYAFVAIALPEEKPTTHAIPSLHPFLHLETVTNSGTGDPATIHLHNHPMCS